MSLIIIQPIWHTILEINIYFR